MDSDQRDLTPIALGLCVTVAGVVLLLHNFGVIDVVRALRYWPAALVVIGGAMMWTSLKGGKTTMPLGAIFWLIVLGAVFNHAFARRHVADAPLGAGEVNLFAVMGEDRRGPANGHFSGGKVTAVLGGAQLDLRQALLFEGEEAVIDVFTMMGGTTIRVPAGWNVKIDASAVAGGISNRVPTVMPGGQETERPALTVTSPGRAPLAPPQLVVRGTVMMGALNIRP